MNKVGIIALNLILVTALGLVGCTNVSPPATGPSSPTAQAVAELTPSSPGVEIYEVNVGNYRTSYDLQGNPAPDCIDATLSWTTNKPCYFQFSVKPVGFDNPENWGGTSIVLFDVSRPLHQSLQVTEHWYNITLRPGTLHRYDLIVWDTEGNSDRREGAFQSEGFSAPSSPAVSDIDQVFLSRWGHPYYNNAARVSYGYDPFGVERLVSQTNSQIPWQLCYQRNVFDCSEMAAYLEYVLERHGYTAQICVGEIGSNKHAWVLVYNDVAKCWIPVETTSPFSTLEAPLFYILTGGVAKDYYTPRSKWEDIYRVAPVSEYDWWNSPYADRLVEASDKAKLEEPLPPLPEIKYPDLPPLPPVNLP